MKKRRLKSGMATVEALLVLPVFMGFMMFFISYATLGLLESRMQYAADQAAKEISQYYYLAYVMGLNYGGIQANQDVDTLFASVRTLTSDAVSTSNVAESTVKNISDASSQISGAVKNGNLTAESAMSIYNSVNTSVGEASNLWDLVKILVSDIKTVWKDAKQAATVGNVKSIAGNTAAAAIHTALSPVISEACFWKYISYSDNGTKLSELKSSADPILKSLGVVGGADGVSFTGSAFMLDGQSIKVAVSYSVKLFSFGVFDIGEMNMTQVAITRAWVGGEDPSTGVPSIKDYK